MSEISDNNQNDKYIEVIQNCLKEFNERMQPIYDVCNNFENRISSVLKKIAEKLKPVGAFNKLATNQFTYWKLLSLNDVEEILNTEDIDAFLLSRIDDCQFINYDDVKNEIESSRLLSETNRAIFLQAMDAIEFELFDLCLVGVVSLFDGALTKATSDSSTNIKNRLDKIEAKIIEFSDQDEIDYLNEKDISDIGLFITWTKTMTEFQKRSEFAIPESEPETINRHWIAHGRKTTKATKLDCFKMINALYGLVIIDNMTT